MARTDARSSAIMAAGTLVSRVLGFLKAILLTVALGALSTVGDVFETANTLPQPHLRVGRRWCVQRRARAADYQSR